MILGIFLFLQSILFGPYHFCRGPHPPSYDVSTNVGLVFSFFIPFGYLKCGFNTLFLHFHSGCTVTAGLIVFWVLSAIEFSICAKKK